MIEKSLGLLFYLKRPKNYISGPIPIYFRITVDGVPKEISTKLAILPDAWNHRADRASGTKAAARKINEYLDHLVQKAYEARLFLLERGRLVTSKAIRALITGEEERTRNLLVLFKAHNEELESMIGNGTSKGTYTNFCTAYKHTQSFIKWKYKVDDVNILSLSLSFVTSFYAYLRSVKRLAHNSAIKNIANMKKIVLACKDEGWLKVDPFVKFDMKREEVDIVYLTEEELMRIVEKEIRNERLAKVRDIFVFCCFTGLAYSDVLSLKRKDLVIGVDGKLWIDKRRQKTKTAFKVPLLSIALRILQKYEHDEYCKEHNTLLPVISNQKLNAYLKELADICEVNKVLSTHKARFTFGTTVTLANDVPMEVVRDMLGHKSLRQTKHYSRVIAQSIGRHMDKLEQTLDTRKWMTSYAASSGESATAPTREKQRETILEEYV